MRLSKSRGERSGATTVEFAFVAIILFLLLFGIFEYARYLFVYHMATNAARDAARFAVVHTSGGTMPGEPATITTADVQEVWRSGMFNSKMYGSGMCGMENQITGYTVNVFAVPDASLYAIPPDLNPAGKPAWNTAGFHQQIAVQVTGTYKPVVPNLVGMSSNVPFSVTVLMASEAN
jgi:Flp pilus assembly protein TadG